MRYSVIVLMLLASISQAQIWEDFSDGDLSQDPAWGGELHKFNISNSSAIPANMRPALQLNEEEAGTAYLSLELENFPAMQWDFWIKLSFNTSASNYARIYLLSDGPDFGDIQEGYFIQVGGSEDSVWFGKSDTAGGVLLYTIPGLTTGNSTNSLRIKIVKEINGTWRFFGEASGSTSLLSLGNIHMQDTVTGNYFGLYCCYTSSNSKKFYFDDLYCGPEIVDSTGPAILRAKVVPPGEIQLEFDETVDKESAEITSNYSLSGGVGNPFEVFYLSGSGVISLFFEEEILEEVLYQLMVSGVTDIIGLAMKDTVIDVSWYRPRPYDIIINEILADPTPPELLPEQEYIELYNRTGWGIDLDKWSLLISGKEYEINGATINPYGYLLLMDIDALPEFQFCGPATGFSSFSISNEEAGISLMDTSGAVICHTLYNKEKYSDAEKGNGGWSLERTDPWYPCQDENSWMGSSNASGGTPGLENSTIEELETSLIIKNVCCLTDSSVLLKFNTSLLPESLSNPVFYSADHGLGQPVRAESTGEAADEVLLTFWGPIVAGTLYRLTVSHDLLDCEGFPVGSDISGVFSLSSGCMPFDVIFNEVLFNSLSDGAEYIELYNRSARTIHLDELFLANVREVPPNLPDTEFYNISISCKSLFPGEYIALTKFPDKVFAQFHVENGSSVFKTSPFPALNNEKGKLLLLDKEVTTIDGLDYSDDMHYPLLNSFAGVALERVCTEIHCSGPEYWHTASSSSGFGTPGYMNSQYQDHFENEHALNIARPAFSPNGDGKDDLLGISCQFGEPGMLISLMIFNENGRLARILVNNALAGTENMFYWDGQTEDRGMAPAGIYIVLLECVSIKGYSKKYKKAAVLL